MVVDDTFYQFRWHHPLITQLSHNLNHGKTIYPAENFISLKLFKIHFDLPWAPATSEVTVQQHKSNTMLMLLLETHLEFQNKTKGLDFYRIKNFR